MVIGFRWFITFRALLSSPKILLRFSSAALSFKVIYPWTRWSRPLSPPDSCLQSTNTAHPHLMMASLCNLSPVNDLCVVFTIAWLAVIQHHSLETTTSSRSQNALVVNKAALVPPPGGVKDRHVLALHHALHDRACALASGTSLRFSPLLPTTSSIISSSTTASCDGFLSPAGLQGSESELTG